MNDQHSITIQSANRPQNVPEMQEHLYPYTPTWYVPEDNVQDYSNAGADYVVGVEGNVPMKPLQLNAAIDDGHKDGLTVVTLDDDFISGKKIYDTDEGKRRANKISLNQILDEIGREFVDHPAKLAGCMFTTNAMFASHGHRDFGWVSGALYFHKPNPLRFDTDMVMNEDLDYVINHHVTHGIVMRWQHFLLDFHILGRSAKSDAKYTGGFGAEGRTNKRQAEVISYLLQKYNRNPALRISETEVGKSMTRSIQWKKLYEYENVPTIFDAME